MYWPPQSLNVKSIWFFWDCPIIHRPVNESSQKAVHSREAIPTFLKFCIIDTPNVLMTDAGEVIVFSDSVVCHS